MVKERILKPFGSTGVQNAINEAVFKGLDNIVVYPVADETHFADNDGNVLPNALWFNVHETLGLYRYENPYRDCKNFIYGVHAVSKKRLGKDYELMPDDIARIVTAAK